jgi:hypothetical protein
VETLRETRCDLLRVFLQVSAVHSPWRGGHTLHAGGEVRHCTWGDLRLEDVLVTLRRIAIIRLVSRTSSAYWAQSTQVSAPAELVILALT